MRKSIYCKRSIAAHQSFECTSVRTKVSLHASQWAPGVLFPEAVKCAEKGTTRERQQGLTTCFDRTESGRLCAEMLGPPRFTPPVCFPSPEQHRSFTYVSLPCLPGIGVLDTTKKVTEECWVRDYDLLICTPLNSNLTVWGCDAHSGE